ncbi:hypothetical protein EVAR_16114_1 [Eumeta japonica]|uniref:Cuticle protein 6 n=1 Tax=Eumeta variegata TaxID=151549 RepID=A0A4C1UIF8_EUMVA|nr:hypothetical protein EVAR_16114_1 [Eumeta japonica]
MKQDDAKNPIDNDKCLQPEASDAFLLMATLAVSKSADTEDEGIHSNLCPREQNRSGEALAICCPLQMLSNRRKTTTTQRRDDRTGELSVDIKTAPRRRRRHIVSGQDKGSVETKNWMTQRRTRCTDDLIRIAGHRWLCSGPYVVEILRRDVCPTAKRRLSPITRSVEKYTSESGRCALRLADIYCGEGLIYAPARFCPIKHSHLIKLAFNFQVLLLVVYTAAIRVPVDNQEEKQTTEAEGRPAEAESADKAEPVLYAAKDDNVDSYLLPPDPHAPDEEYATSDGESGTPATFLLPPLPNASVDYHAPQPPPVQTDWYPIVQAPFKPFRYKARPKALPFVSIPIEPAVSVATEPQPQQGSDVEPEDPVLENVPLPSSELQPPKDEPADYGVSAPSADLQLPVIESKKDFEVPAVELQLPLIETPPNFNTQLVKELPLKFNLNPAHPTLALHLTPPKPPVLYKYKNPTKLYPKKYVSGFKPIPIPLMAYDDYRIRDVPKVQYIKAYDALPNSDLVAPDDKKVFEFEKADQKRKLKEEEDLIKQEEIIDTEADFPPTTPANEPDASETGYRHPGRTGSEVKRVALERESSGFNPNRGRIERVLSEIKLRKDIKPPASIAVTASAAMAVRSHLHLTSTQGLRYPGPIGPPRPVPIRLVSQPLRVAPHPPPASAEKPAEREPTAPPPGDRTEFRMHGMNGPHSYQFGYDTGKGKNRQFRYEERDNDGRVHGHYGYMDKRGKLRVVKYEADPERGFHSDAVPDPDDSNPDAQP